MYDFANEKMFSSVEGPDIPEPPYKEMSYEEHQQEYISRLERKIDRLGNENERLKSLCECYQKGMQEK